MKKIILNARVRETDANEFTYEDIVDLAGMSRDRVATITWFARTDDGAQATGTVAPGDVLEVRNGMILSCTFTDAS